MGEPAKGVLAVGVLVGLTVAVWMVSGTVVGVEDGVWGTPEAKSVTLGGWVSVGVASWSKATSASEG